MGKSCRSGGGSGTHQMSVASNLRFIVYKSIVRYKSNVSSRLLRIYSIWIHGLRQCGSLPRILTHPGVRNIVKILDIWLSSSIVVKSDVKLLEILRLFYEATPGCVNVHWTTRSKSRNRRMHRHKKSTSRQKEQAWALTATTGLRILLIS